MLLPHPIAEARTPHPRRCPHARADSAQAQACQILTLIVIEPCRELFPG